MVDPPMVDVCAAANSTNEWGYDAFGGPQCWNTVCNHGNGEGCLGSSQSPINITGAVDVTDLPSLSFSLSSTPTAIKNNGHTLEFEQEPGSFITYGKTANNLFNDFTLGQFHFHANSEHQVDGKYTALECHMVHRSIWSNEYVVLSVMFEEGASNPFLAQFVDDLPAAKDQEFNNPNLTYNPMDLLPTNKSYYTYSGSLTTPPCFEIVNWIVMENKVEASAAEIAAFSTILKENFRPLQDLNGRVISHVVK